MFVGADAIEAAQSTGLRMSEKKKSVHLFHEVKNYKGHYQLKIVAIVKKKKFKCPGILLSKKV